MKMKMYSKCFISYVYGTVSYSTGTVNVKNKKCFFSGLLQEGTTVLTVSYQITVKTLYSTGTKVIYLFVGFFSFFFSFLYSTVPVCS